MLMEQMEIVTNEWIAGDTYEMTLKGSLVKQLNQPGQFLHVQVGDGWEHVLRRPLSIAHVDQVNQQVTVIYKQVGKGTRKLQQIGIGNTANVLGPRGEGFPIEHVHRKRILLIGGGVGVPPLYYLGKKLMAQNNEVVSVLGFQTKEAVFYETKFTELGTTYIATEDGSYGVHGRVTDLISEIGADIYYSCGPKPMLKAITNQMSIPGYISLEERMGCGIGACFACVCEVQDSKDRKGYRKICQDGPVFEANEVKL